MNIERKAAQEACDAGFLTCTRGQPGDPDATYALGWLPLDDPWRFSTEVRERHAENMRKMARSMTESAE